MNLSRDAVVFGIGYLNGPRMRLSFGGDHAEMRITKRARSALNELLSAGYAEPDSPDAQHPGREYYRGMEASPSLGEIARAMGITPFDRDDGDDWTCFERRK